MGENIITWNVTNWITIFLMAFLGFVILALLGSLFHSSRRNKEQSSGMSAQAPVAGS
jgi:hypothetical protein